MQKIYIDNCLTTKPDPLVIEAMMPYFTDKFYYPANFVKDGSAAKKDIASFKKIIADSMNAEVNEIHFTSSGTSANNIGIKGYIMANSDKGNHIICSEVDYPDILTNAAFFADSGFDVTVISADKDGFINLQELEAAITKNTILIMTTLVNHVLGTIQPINKIKEIINNSSSKPALFADAAEGYGRMHIDVKELDIDMMSISGHKIHGPQGIGALFVKNGIHLAQTKHGIARIDDLETGGLSVANMAGMAKAVEIQFSDLDKHIEQMRFLQKRLLTGISEKNERVLVNGPVGESRICNNLNISLDYVEGEAIMVMLDTYGIAVATGSACASQGLKPNYVLMATGRSFVQSHGSIKFNLSRMNTEAEIDYTIDKFTDVIEKLKKMSPLFSKE